VVPEDLNYTSHDVWCRIEEDGAVTIGVTEYALRSVGEIIYIDLPDVEDDVLTEVPFGEIEGTKAIHELFSPFDGVVKKVNAERVYDPDALPKDPYQAGWLIRLQPDKPPSTANLLSAADYEKNVRKRRR